MRPHGLQRGLRGPAWSTALNDFRPVDRRIRFDVSLDSADRSRLRLSARLLAAADYVQPRTP